MSFSEIRIFTFRLLATALFIISADATAEARDSDLRQELPDYGGVVTPYDTDSVKKEMKERGMHRLEGIWRVTDGATIVIERDLSEAARRGDNTVYRIIVTESPDRSIRPGTILGYAAPTARPEKFDARLFTHPLGRILTKSGISSDRYTLTLTNDDSRIEFERHRRGLKVDIRKTLPLLLRTTLRYDAGNRNTVPSGCVRLFPSPSLPGNPIYL